MFFMVEAVQNIVEYMTASHFKFFLHVVIDAHNKNLEKREVGTRGECAVLS